MKYHVMAMISLEMMLIRSLLVPTLMSMNHENQTAMATQEVGRVTMQTRQSKGKNGG